MHIVLITPYCLPHIGGIERVTDALARQYNIIGHQVSLITSNSTEQAFKREITWHQIDVQCSNILEKFEIPYPIFYPIELYKALKSVVDTADIVHVHGILYMSSIFAVWVARQYGVKVVVTEHAGFVIYKNPIINLVEKIAIATAGRLTLKLSTAIVATNSRVAHQIKPFVQNKPMLIIHHGIDTSSFTPLNNKEGKFRLRNKYGLGSEREKVILYVGRLVDRKGISFLTDAIDTRWQVVICGPGALNPIYSNIRVLGKVTDIELLDLYRLSDLLVLFSHSEGRPLVVQEALSTGLPVVVTDNPDFREFLSQEVCVFTPLTSDHIFKTINSLLENDNLLTRMEFAARIFALQHFDIQQTKEQYLDLYNSLLSAKESF